MADLTAEQLLTVFEKLFISNEVVPSTKLASETGLPHQKVIGLIKSISAAGDYITTSDRTETHLELLGEGLEIAKNGSHEFVFWKNVPEEGIGQADAMKLPNAKIGMGKALAAKWIKKDKSDGKIYRMVTDEPGQLIFFIKLALLLILVDTIYNYCQKVSKGEQMEAKEIADLKKRKLIKESKETVFDCKKSAGFQTTIAKPETDLSRELLDSGEWASKTFKDYNFEAEGVPPSRGFLHPLLKVRAAYRQIFLEMGFEEMPTNNFVESSFWNFDALFQPQQHPARDAHDTFFLSDPQSAHIDPPTDYLERVKNIHSHGGYGSKGYGYDWSKEEAMKNVLRTHTTAVSAKMLYKLAQRKEFKPTKYFRFQKLNFRIFANIFLIVLIAFSETKLWMQLI